ncbi:hypothetical protein Slin14017_G060370 [Septoria linicola]|nr:hypothetical protein Slin14017_G060370 [Septoria linicola]
MPIGRLGLSFKTPALQRVAPFCTKLTIKVMFNAANSPFTMGAAVIEDRNHEHLVEQRRQDFEKRRPPAGIARAIWNARNQFKEDATTPSIATTSKQRVLMGNEARYLDRTLVEQVLQALVRLAVLEIQVNGDPGWPGVTRVEDAIICLRQALEASKLPALSTISFRPVHAAGIVHLRWAAFGAFRDRPFVSRPQSLIPSVPRSDGQLWTKLAILDLQIRNPSATSRIGEKQMMMFIQVLEDYLRSFCRTLRGLHFVWLDAPGPSPLVLCDLLERERTVWPNLKEFWYGNVTSPGSSLGLLPICMPQVTDLRRLKSSATDCKAEGWQAVDLVRSADHAQRSPLRLHRSPSRLSQLSLIPAPLALPKAATPLNCKGESHTASSICSAGTANSDQTVIPGDSRETNDICDKANAQAMAVSSEEQRCPSHMPLFDAGVSLAQCGERERAGRGLDRSSGAIESQKVPGTRRPVASSIYSRDENGDYVPVRRRWDKSQPSATQQQQLARGIPALLASGQRLSTTTLSDTRGNTAVLDKKISSASNTRMTPESGGRLPPQVSPVRTVARRKNYVDLGDMPAYQAARSEYLRQHPAETSDMSHAADHVSSPKNRIRNWAQAVKSGRPPSTVSARSINTVDTTGSRPLSKFFSNIRETGRPARPGRS